MPWSVVVPHQRLSTLGTPPGSALKPYPAANSLTLYPAANPIDVQARKITEPAHTTMSMRKGGTWSNTRGESAV